MRRQFEALFGLLKQQGKSTYAAGLLAFKLTDTNDMRKLLDAARL